MRQLDDAGASAGDPSDAGASVEGVSRRFRKDVVGPSSIIRTPIAAPAPAPIPTCTAPIRGDRPLWQTGRIEELELFADLAALEIGGDTRLFDLREQILERRLLHFVLDR